MARLARSVYRSNNGHRRGARAEPQFSSRGNPPSGAPARDRPSSPGQRPSAHQPRRITGWSAGLRPASRGSAKPAPTTRPPPTAQNLAGHASDRHRADRNPPHASRTTASPTAESRRHGALASSPGGGLRPASRGSAKPAPTTPPPANLTPANPRIANRANHADMERRPVLPVGASDRHRAAARNPHQQPRPPPISRLQTHASPTAQNHADMERRPVLPVGASDRHRAAARNPHQQPRPPPISRLQTHASPTAQNHADMERWPVLPVGASDRHRAAARNPHQQRRPPPISRLRTHASPTAQNHGDMERRSPTGNQGRAVPGRGLDLE